MSSRVRPPSKTAEQTFAALKQFAGEKGLLTALLTAALGISLGWFGDAAFSLLTTPSSWDQFTTLCAKRGTWLGLLCFPLLVWWLWRQARRRVGRVPVQVRQDDAPKSVRGLIVFLSPPFADADALQRDRQAPGRDPLKGAFFKYLKGSWRMPLEAVDYHREKLEQLIVITSADSHTGARAGQPDGTWRDFALFKDTVARLETDRRVQVLSLPSFPEGVDFENAALLVTAVDEAYRELEAHGIRGAEALIDITGGQKVVTVVGAAGALADDRQFQYVSTHDYHVRSYDITYNS